MRKEKEWTDTGCAFWILGLVLFIAGLNIEGETGSWMNVAGSVLFLLGLGISGAVWVIRKKNEQEEK